MKKKSNTAITLFLLYLCTEKNEVMQKQAGIIFDLDGVIIDTEPIYDVFWSDAAIRYHVGIEHFERVIKGTTMPNIMERYFSGHTQQEREQLIKECAEFELKMPINPVSAAISFLALLKEMDYKVALATSSELHKLEYVFSVQPIRHFFDVIVTSERVKHGKPNPDCYLLAAAELGKEASECLVFEDSLNGIKAANAAGARVIGVTTSLSPDLLHDSTIDTIPDFRGVGIDDINRWSKGM